MKKIYLFAVAAAMFAACSSNEDLSQDNQQQAPNLEEGAVGFDVYMQRNTTRAGWVGESTTPALQDFSVGALGESGFGVFGYYTNNNEYDPQSLPNFFYNQQVKYDGAKYVYEPIKYWPNEYGTNAISDDADKVTFFAYLPWVEVVPSTGKIKEADKAKWGITGMTRNIANGDPIIKYLVSFDADKMVDLCWGVCDNPEWATINNGDKMLNDGVKGMPWLDVERPLEAKSQADATQRVKFTFKHALSQLNVTADTYADGTSPQSIDAASRVYIRSITFTGIATKGALNLHNETPNKAQWLDYNGTADLESGEEVTIYDGRKDGKEGTAGGIATNEKVLGLNPMFVQDENQLSSGKFINTGDAYHTGVDGTTRNMFRKWDTDKYVAMAANAPIYVIPTGEEVTVTIVYDVETPSQNLGVYLSDGKTAGSTIENRITKTVDFGPNGMENGKKYTIHLHLGMNSVKLEANVTGWDSNTPENDINVPSNTPEFVAATNAEYNFNVPAVGTANPTVYNVKLTGFNGGSVITPTKDETLITADPTGVQADAAGVVGASFKVANSTSVLKKTGWAMWTGNGKQVKLNITQQPIALGLAAALTDAQTITLSSTTGATDAWTNIELADASKRGISVVKNGVKLNYTSSTPGANQFKYDAGEITLPTAEGAQPGDIFEITVKAGDAPEETITRRVGGITYAPASMPVTFREPGHTYDVKPTYYGENPSPTITYASSVTTVAANPDTDGKLQTSDVGNTIITASLTASPANFELADNATLKVEVIQQNSKIDGFTTATVNKAASDLYGSGIAFVSLNSHKAVGIEDTDHTVTGAVSWALISAKKGDTDCTSKFTINASNGVCVSENFNDGTHNGTYTIVVKGTHAGDSHYKATEQTVTITLTVS